MAENNLISRILSDASATADAIIQKARFSAVENKKQAEERAMQLRQETYLALEEQRKKTLERKATVAEIDAKKELLSAKVECVDMAFFKALQKLCELDKKEYTAFVVKMLNKYADNGDVVVLAKNCVVDKQEISKTDVFFAKNLSFGEDGDFAGGLVLCGKNYDKRLTFEELLREERSVLQGEIFAKLINV